MHNADRNKAIAYEPLQIHVTFITLGHASLQGALYTNYRRHECCVVRRLSFELLPPTFFFLPWFSLEFHPHPIKKSELHELRKCCVCVFFIFYHNSTGGIKSFLAHFNISQKHLLKRDSYRYSACIFDRFCMHSNKWDNHSSK